MNHVLLSIKHHQEGVGPQSSECRNATASCKPLFIVATAPFHAFYRSWSLDYILNTHHHHDHVGGNSYLKSTYGCTIVGFSGDSQRIPLMDVGVAEGDTVTVGDLSFRVFEVPGELLTTPE